jgi:hypothetical protein
MRAVPDQRVTDATSPSRRAPTPKFPSSPIPAQAAEAALIGIREREPKVRRWPAMHVTATQRPTQRIGPPAVMAQAMDSPLLEPKRDNRPDFQISGWVLNRISLARHTHDVGAYEF